MRAPVTWWAVLILGLGGIALAADGPGARRPDKGETGRKGLLPDAKHQKKVLRDLLGAKADPDEAATNPLLTLGKDMREVEQRLAANDAGEQTREIQKKIVANLDALLEQCQQSQGGGQSKNQSQSKQQQITMGQSKNLGEGAKSGAPRKGGGNKGQNPATAAGRGKAEKPQLTTLKETVQDVWGHLPDKDRELMKQSFKEAFLPEYQDLIKEYYQRISEQSVTNAQP